MKPSAEEGERGAKGGEGSGRNEVGSIPFYGNLMSARGGRRGGRWEEVRSETRPKSNTRLQWK